MPASPGPRHEVHFAVADTGIGITADRMERLFKSFTQVDVSTTRQYGGTGLGLAISARLAEAMGGRVWVESEVARGSTFHFTIVVAGGPSRPRIHFEGAQPRLAGKRLLVVDDNATIRRILTQQVRSWAMVPRPTASAHEALAWVRQGDPFDVAIFDMQMPEMDGLTLAAEVRKHRDASALPVVMLTAAMGLRREDVSSLQFADLLTKPIKPSQLFDVLMGILAEQSVGTQRSSDPRRLDAYAAERLPLRILVAEDNPVNQKVALRILERMGYRADVVGNGLETLNTLKQRPYDVVLMDVRMPEMDGLEATRRICQQWPRAERPRVIALTASAVQGDREACLAAGMDDYISKPVRVAELRAALERCQPRGRSGVGGPGGGRDAGPGSA